MVVKPAVFQCLQDFFHGIIIYRISRKCKECSSKKMERRLHGMRISGNTWKARKNSRMLSIKNCACAKKMLAIQTSSGYNKHQRKCSGFYFFHLLIYFSMRYSRIFPDSHLMIYLTLARSEVFGALQHTWMLTQRRMEQADCPLSISGNQLSSNHTAGIFSKNWPVIIYHTHQKE